MNNCLSPIGIFIFVVFGLLSACGLVKSYEPFRYRLTVEVDTPRGIRSGSSVIEVEAGEVGTTLGGGSAEARGEAVAVDIAPGKTMFALLRSEAPYEWATGVMFGVTPQSDNRDMPSKDSFKASIEAVRANKKLNLVPRWFLSRNDADPPVAGYPILVKFLNLDDPTTIQKVDPDDLASSFGPSVKLRRITVQLTDDPVTTGIVKRLPWLPNQKLSLVPNLINVPVAERPFGVDVYSVDFAKGTL